MKIDLNKTEIDAALWAIGQMTIGNANDIDEMMSCGMSRKEAKALKQVEMKMMDALKYMRSLKQSAL